MSKKITKIFLLILLSFLVFSSSANAATNAIGIRVARNLEHLSPSAWYDKYAPNWYGSGGGGPSSISLANYEAVSVGSCSSGQGETIYVNAANIDSGNLYTNIYIIACPVNADQDTIDIFEQLINNWSFNVNISDETEKGQIQRDTKRLSDLTTLTDLIENYRAKISPDNHYPELASGTYQAGRSLSYWTSWQNNLGAELQTTLPTPPTGPGWGTAASLTKWTGQEGQAGWPAALAYPTTVGVTYTSEGCRQIAVVRDQALNSWCGGSCGSCPAGLTTDNVVQTWPWPIPRPTAIGARYNSSDCRELLAVADGQYLIWRDNYGTSAGCSSQIIASGNLTDYISDWPSELQEPTALAWDTNYNNCEQLLVVKDNRWSEHFSNLVTNTDCPFVGWLPVADLTTAPETLNTSWPAGMQNPEAIALTWDDNNQRRLYAFKDNKYREYIDYNRPYLYYTGDQGLSYSICTYFETAYPSLTEFNCSGLQAANYAPTIIKLIDRQVSIGQFFNYDIMAVDLDGDVLSWSVDLGLGCGSQTISSGYVSCGWGNQTLYAAKTGQKNTIKIYGTAPDSIPTPSSITIQITATDNQAATGIKSFNLTVGQAGTVITSTAVTNITIGDNYEYDVEAYDAEGYYPLTYSWAPQADPPVPPSINALPPGMDALPPNSSIDAVNGLIFGAPNDLGSYNVRVTVANSNPNGANSTIQDFTINVKNFKIADIPDTDMTHDQTLNFFAATIPEEVKRIEWSIDISSCDRGGVPCDITPNFGTDFLSKSIDPNSGEIIITINDEAALNDIFSIIVTATSTLNPLVIHSEDFDITIVDAMCSNSVVEVGEECDDGANGDDTDQCYDDCAWTYCGDNIVQDPNGYNENEDCDDGVNGNDTDQCYDDCAFTYCGDNIVQSPNGYNENEECDDGNDNNNDSCPDSVAATCKLAFCGDGFIWDTDGGSEECDDNNTDSGDGCNHSCAIETGWTCSGEPSVCLIISSGVWTNVANISWNGNGRFNSGMLSIELDSDKYIFGLRVNGGSDDRGYCFAGIPEYVVAATTYDASGSISASQIASATHSITAPNGCCSAGMPGGSVSFDGVASGSSSCNGTTFCWQKSDADVVSLGQTLFYQGEVGDGPLSEGLSCTIDVMYSI